MTAGLDATGNRGVVICVALPGCVAGLDTTAMVVMEQWAILREDIHVLKIQVIILDYPKCFLSR